MARAKGRMIALGLAVVAAGAGAYDAARGGWLGGSILTTAALWLLTLARPPRKAPASVGPGRAEAAATLGVAETAGRDEIEAAYRRLMFRVHPDQGGSAALAAQINAAREALLGR
jgi:DnaJ-domain-containing protein 1